MTSLRHVSAERLSEWLDGDMSERDAAAVRAHLAACEACAACAGELRVQSTALRGLARPEPSAALWSSIEGTLEGDERRRWSWPSWLMGALAGAVTAMVIVWLAFGGREVAPAEGLASERSDLRGRGGAHADGAPVAVVGMDPLLVEAEQELAHAATSYAQAAGRLRAILEREQARWAPATRARVAERLARLDEAIVHSRDVAARDPGDGASAELLFSAYRRQIDFLAEAVHRGSPGAEERLR